MLIRSSWTRWNWFCYRMDLELACPRPAAEASPLPATVPVPLISNAAFRKLAPHQFVPYCCIWFIHSNWYCSRDLAYASRPATAVGSLSLDIAQDRVTSNAVLRRVALLAPLQFVPLLLSVEFYLTWSLVWIWYLQVHFQLRWLLRCRLLPRRSW